mgnify:CR=1 FL=1
MLNELMNIIRKEIYETIEKLGYLDSQIIPNPDSIVLETDLSPVARSLGTYPYSL